MAKAKSPFILGLASKSNREPPRHFIKTAAFKLINPSVKHSCSHRAEFGSPEYDGGVNSDIFFSSSSLIIILFSFFFFYLCVCNSLCFSFVQNNFFSQNQVSIHSVIQVNSSSSLTNEKKNTLALLCSLQQQQQQQQQQQKCVVVWIIFCRFFLSDFFPFLLSLSLLFSLSFLSHAPLLLGLQFNRLLQTKAQNHHGESTRGVLLGARMAVREEEQRVRPRVREPNAHVRGERQRDREARI
jgi:hypothetical protein